MNGFAEELKRLVDETLALKTGYPKTATALATKEEDTTLDFHLELPPMPPYNYATSETRNITLEALENMVSAIYLNPTDDAQNYELSGRYVRVSRRKVGTENSFDVYIYSVNESDIWALQNGQTVTLTYSFKVVGTSDYDLTIS